MPASTGRRVNRTAVNFSSPVQPLCSPSIALGPLFSVCAVREPGGCSLTGSSIPFRKGREAGSDHVRINEQPQEQNANAADIGALTVLPTAAS